ncbi:MAG TPA: aldo/keto reductase [Acidimicrobiales bacterium]|nr:aldo/keto reductase [Acidimicrobiales bacterium]
MSLIDPTPRELGPGLSAGPLGFGLWRYVHADVGHATEVLEAALDSGLTLVDAADVYGFDWGGAGFGAVESLLGKVLAGRPDLRDRMILASKGGIAPPVPYDSSATHLRSACEASLTRLGVDRIDLYQVHRPDLLAHPAEVANTLMTLASEGKIGLIGVSNHSPPQHRALARHLDAAHPIAATQPEYSATHLDPLRDGTFDLCMEQNMTPIVWSPLAGGSLAGGEGVSVELLMVLDRLAEREAVDRATLALAFTIAHPSRPIALIGSQTPERIASLTRAIDVTLDRNDVYDLIEASQGEPLP